MNMPDEYWTTEVPTEPDVYVVKTADGRVDLHIPPRGSRLASLAGARFCRLALPAEVERLKVELQEIRYVRDNDLAELIHLLAQLEKAKAENEKLRELGAALRDSAANLGYTSSLASTVISRATKNVEAWDAYIARLEGRAE